MNQLTTDLLSRACRVFMGLAYAGAVIPAKKQPYAQIPPQAPLEDYLPPAPLAMGIAKISSTDGPTATGYTFRLGCTHYEHLKLCVQRCHYRRQLRWVFSVDTHDAFSKEFRIPPADDPDARAWAILQAQNNELKHRIEEALEQAGFDTFVSLLRLDLPTTVPLG